MYALWQQNRLQHELLSVFFQKKDISEEGRRVLTELFRHALSYEASVENFLRACEEEYRLTWQYQDSWYRADPAAVDVRGIQNRAACENICRALKIPSLPGKEPHIPMDSFSVEAGPFTYRFSGVIGSGRRTVLREKEAIDFRECKIVRIIIDEPMVLMPNGCTAYAMHVTAHPVRSLKRV